MTAATAAGYVNERSVEAFRRRVGTVYPRPRHIKGRGEVWRKADLDDVIGSLCGEQVKDAELLL
jgi:hypothetical protein